MKLLTKQEHAIFYLNDNTTTEVLYGGAAGGGKSAIGCLWLQSMCQMYPGTRWLMGRSKLKTLKETTLNTFFDLASHLGITDQYNYNSQMGLITFKNGSEIILKDLFLYPSDPNFDSLGSLEITGAFIDECNQLVYKAWQVVKSRIRYKLNEYNLIPKLLGTCNPAKNWTYKQFYIPTKNGTLKDDRAFIKALPTDNPHLPESYLKSLLELDKNSRNRLYFGNWEYDDDPSALMSYDSILAYWNGNHVAHERETFLTIDVARKGKDKTVFRVWRGWVCIYRKEMAKSLITEVIEEAKILQLKFKITNNNTIADEDGVGGGVVDGLLCLGFLNGGKPIGEYVSNEYLQPNYLNLKSQCSILMAKKIEKKEVAEVCNEQSVIDIVSEEMEQIKYKDIDKDGKLTVVGKDKVKEMIGRSPDDWDSIMMRYYFELIPEESIIRY